MDIKKTISDNIFHDYDSEEVQRRNSVDYHDMTDEHAEILGQFLNYTAMDVEQLKECLDNYSHNPTRSLAQWMDANVEYIHMRKK